MARYICNNKQCALYNKEQNENMHITYGKHGAIDHKASCPVCKKTRERVDNNGLCTTMHGGENCCNK